MLTLLPPSFGYKNMAKLSLLASQQAGEARISLWLLGAAAFMVIADMRVIDPLLHIIANDLNASVGSAAIIVSAYTIPYGLFQLVYGPLGDRIGKVRVMAGAIAAFAIGTAACAIVPNLASLALLRFVTGVAAAAIIPLSLAYIGDTYPYEQRQAAIGRYLSSLMLGQILGGSLGGIFGEYLSWRDIFLVFGVASLVIAGLLWRVAQDLPRSVKGSQAASRFLSLKPYLQLMSDPLARLVIVGVFIEGFFLFAGSTYIGAFLRDRYQLSYLLIGFMLSGFGIGGLLYSASVKWLVRRLRENGLILVGGWLVCTTYLCMVLFQQWMLVIPLIMVLGLGFYMMHSTLQTRATELSPEARGTAVSLFAFSLFLGQGVGAIALGRIVDGPGYTTSFVITGVAIALLSIWLVSQFRRLFVSQ
jgi:predicted MFS family arabinose efflux permease